VLFDRQRAVGVEYSVGETKHEARAAREIVVCAGAVNSPQLLELSGVGSADRLRALGIPVVQHLPGVGENLQDHYLARLSWRVTRPVTFNERTRGLRLIGEVFKYVFAGRGVLNVAAAQLCAFLKTRTDLDAPDAELTVTPWSLDSGRIGVLEREPGMSMAAFQLRPESRGSIHIKTADPRDQPIIRPNYLSAETDRQVTVATMRIGRKLVESPELDAYRGIETNPGSDLKTDDELLDYARRTGSSVGHVASTCRMGIDAMAVVDSELLVHGLSRLRVADASIMPTMISGHTNAPAIMIGEKAADLIKAAERA
jgi:choline dehydrogenase-like flavoprotein